MSSFLEFDYAIENVIVNVKLLKCQGTYQISPIEGLADIKLHQEIMWSLFHIRETVPNLIEFERVVNIENLLRGYDDNL